VSFGRSCAFSNFALRSLAEAALLHNSICSIFTYHVGSTGIPPFICTAAGHNLTPVQVVCNLDILRRQCKAARSNIKRRGLRFETETELKSLKKSTAPSLVESAPSAVPPVTGPVPGAGAGIATSTHGKLWDTCTGNNARIMLLPLQWESVGRGSKSVHGPMCEEGCVCVCMCMCSTGYRGIETHALGARGPSLRTPEKSATLLITGIISTGDYYGLLIQTHARCSHSH
jgi:hypothetical protein